MSKQEVHRFPEGIPLAEVEKRLGPTEDLPEGSLKNEELGSWRIAIGYDPEQNMCIVQLGTHLAMFFTADEAESLAATFLDVARIMRQRDQKRAETMPSHAPRPETPQK